MPHGSSTSPPSDLETAAYPHDPPCSRVDAAPEAAYRSFLTWFFALLVAIAAAAATFNAVSFLPGEQSAKDPATHRNQISRSQKLDLYDALKRPPEVLVLGSSRAMRINPADITAATGASAFNAAVTGGSAMDSYLFAAHVADAQAGEFPHLVIALDDTDFRNINDELVHAIDERTERYVDLGTRLTTVVNSIKPLFMMQTLERGVRSLVASDPQPSTTRPAGTGDPSEVDELGYSTRALNLWPDEMTVDDRVQSQMQTWIAARERTGRAGWTDLDGSATSYFERMLELANERGDTPTIVLTPYHPSARTMIEPLGYDSSRERLNRYLRDIGETFDVQVIDATDISTFGGDPDAFEDGVHMHPSNTRRLVAYIHRQDGFS